MTGKSFRCWMCSIVESVGAAVIAPRALQQIPVAIASLVQSVFFTGYIVHPSLVCDPVDFPCLASIGRVGLFEMGRIRRDVRPDKSNIDGSALPEFLIVELAAAILEFADHRLNGLAQPRILAFRQIMHALCGWGV